MYESRLDLSQKSIVILLMIGNSLFSYYAVSNLKIYQHSKYPHILSFEAQQSIPRCESILKSLGKEVNYTKRADKLAQLSNCLQPTPLFLTFNSQIQKSKQQNLLLAANRQNKHEVNQAYRNLLEELTKSDHSVFKLKNYSSRFWFHVLILCLCMDFLCIPIVSLFFPSSNF